MTVSLAIFDLDNTLLRGDSDHAWGEFLVEQGAVDPERFAADNDRYYAAYLAGTLDIYEFLEKHQLRPLRENDRSTLEEWRQEFVRKKVMPLITADARTAVEHHRRIGDTLMIITATNRFITAPIADAFGIPNLLATDPEEVDGRFTGRVAGIPCYREGKVTRLGEWLTTHKVDLEGSWFYSDSHNDLPLLKFVTHPVAVNPDPTLEAHARDHGWKILKWQ